MLKVSQVWVVGTASRWFLCSFNTHHHSLGITLLSGPRIRSMFILYFPALALEFASSPVGFVVRLRECMCTFISVILYTNWHIQCHKADCSFFFLSHICSSLLQKPGFDCHQDVYLSDNSLWMESISNLSLYRFWHYPDHLITSGLNYLGRGSFLCSNYLINTE